MHRKETLLTDHVADWARPYGIEAKTVDGNDVDAVYAAARDAVAYIRRTGKPYFLETYTYRLRGHMEPDDQSYVDKGELASWKAKDPLSAYEAKLLEDGEINTGELDAVRERARLRVEDAVKFAFDSPYPSFDQLTSDVYA